MNSLPNSSLNIFLITAGIFISFLGVMWVMSLMQSRKKRAYFQRHPQKTTLIILGFATILLLTTFLSRWSLIGNVDEQPQEFTITPNPNYEQTLTTPVKVNGIELPIGTQVRLSKANNLNEIVEARFQPALVIANLPIEKIDFFRDTDQSIDRILLQGRGVAQIFGWRCDLTRPIDVDLNSNTHIRTLEFCYLASGNRIDGINLPANSELFYSEGTGYVDGYVANDRWMLNTTTPFQLKNFQLTTGRLYFDATQKFIGLQSAFLAKPTQFGDFLYPLGTQVEKELRPNLDGSSYWWFSHQDEKPFSTPNGTTIEHLDSVVQNDLGKTQYIMRHDQNFKVEEHLKNMDDAIGAEQIATSSP